MSYPLLQLSKLEEKYNFKQEEDNSWSFEYKGRKAFFINLSKHSNVNIIIPFVIRRKQLSSISNILNDAIENKLELENLGEFLNYSVEILGNMLDRKKMGSPEFFINTIWKDIDKKDAQKNVNIIEILSEIIMMIDYFTQVQLSVYSKEEVAQISYDYFNKIQNKTFRIHPDGSIEKLDNDIPKDKYDLANMRPLNNQWEI